MKHCDIYIFTLTPRGSYLTLSPSIRLAWVNSEIIARNEKNAQLHKIQKHAQTTSTFPLNLLGPYSPTPIVVAVPGHWLGVYQLATVRAWV